MSAAQNALSARQPLTFADLVDCAEAASSEYADAITVTDAAFAAHVKSKAKKKGAALKCAELAQTRAADKFDAAVIAIVSRTPATLGDAALVAKWLRYSRPNHADAEAVFGFDTLFDFAETLAKAAAPSPVTAEQTGPSPSLAEQRLATLVPHVKRLADLSLMELIGLYDTYTAARAVFFGLAQQPRGENTIADDWDTAMGCLADDVVGEAERRIPDNLSEAERRAELLLRHHIACECDIFELASMTAKLAQDAARLK